MKNFNLFISILIFCFNSEAQNQYIEIGFTAINNLQYQQLDSVKITNQTQNCDTVLYYPDTTLILYVVSSIHGTQNRINSNFKVSPNYPNPFENKTTFQVSLSQNEYISIRISDLRGKLHKSFARNLEGGVHSFNFYPGNDITYLLTVTGQKDSKTIKMLTNGMSQKSNCKIVYLGFETNISSNKSTEMKNSFVFNEGDELMYIGYTDAVESGIFGTPAENQLVEFQFATNIPCPGTPTFVYGEQEYNTIQIFSQCWMKESLNFETENSWCVYNDPEYCDEYGRLYLWEATVGLCPSGWHLPSDDEWRILEGVTDSLYGIMDPVWEQSGGWRGFDAGTNLKSTSEWVYGGNGLDLYGFTAKPGGYQLPNGNNGAATIEVGFWTSTEYENETAWHRFLQYSKIGVYRYPFEKEWGLYVRCLKN